MGYHDNLKPSWSLTNALNSATALAVTWRAVAPCLRTQVEIVSCMLLADVLHVHTSLAAVLLWQMCCMMVGSEMKP